ncbi:MAG: hypothetical protein NWE91_09775, partial [Candidatus Bathyarchaeota archaeon]|nr:hypothetical protein [Candidatus Bathyarchaeota archaeon]
NIKKNASTEINAITLRETPVSVLSSSPNTFTMFCQFFIYQLFSSQPLHKYCVFARAMHQIYNTEPASPLAHKGVQMQNAA